MQPRASKRPVVLIVEDEALVRMSAIEAIEAAGFDVIEACDADEVISILEQRSDIRLVFIDIQMPGQAKITENDLPEGSRFLPKPYAVAEIASAIDQLIRQ
jgi:two-component system, response regulator PdtaR